MNKKQLIKKQIELFKKTTELLKNTNLFLNKITEIITNNPPSHATNWILEEAGNYAESCLKLNKEITELMKNY